MEQETQFMQVDTPLMRQYNSIKAQYPDALILFRSGDFYETFGDDALKSSSVLNITLTRRGPSGSNASIPLAGFPHHAIDTYLPKLVQAGLRVAICEQLEDPKKAKGLVKRGVIEVVTPGVTFNDAALTSSENTFMATICFDGPSRKAGIAILDISTGEFYVGEGDHEYIEKVVSSMSPRELVYNPDQKDLFFSVFGRKYLSNSLEEWAWNFSSNRDKVMRHFKVHSLKGFGVDQMPLAITAAGAALHYLDYTHHTDISHIQSILRLDKDSYVWLDKYSINNLELFSASQKGGSSLTDIIDRTLSPIGGRMLRRWIALPLRDYDEILRRQEAVDLIYKDMSLRSSLQDVMKNLGDPERLISKTAAGRITPRETRSLQLAMQSFRKIKALIADDERFTWINEKISSCEGISEMIDSTLMDEPASQIGKGSVVREGVNSELDDLRNLSRNSKDYLTQLADREAQQTGISSLKISYNNVFGYYIEVRNIHKDKVPAEWIRKQTLVNAERYITAELKEYEQKILGAEDRILEIESDIFSNLIQELQKWVSIILASSHAAAQLDVLLAFAEISLANNYVRPVIDKSQVIDIKNGRHPVIERCLQLGERYIPNDVYLDSESQQIIIITGPNMAGKSALLRQTALIVLMAQMGCFVPATEARIGIVDRIFTRVGASDNISQGESTFMVEMLEASNILNNISSHSLVLFDEIGRGTSTYDGISIAWAIVEYLHSKPGARTLFATHYHELNELESRFSRIKNYNVSVKEIDNKVIFLRKLVPGGTEHSFGIHVASMAGMPRSVVDRANQILQALEAQRATSSDDQNGSLVLEHKESLVIPQQTQLSFFQMDDPLLMDIRDEIQNLDIDGLSPRAALDKLYEIKRLISGKK